MYKYVYELSELILYQNKIYENVPLSMHGAPPPLTAKIKPLSHVWLSYNQGFALPFRKNDCT